ncbi:3-hydroxyisobutyrate dehydrogenase [Pasteurellaceae bacterium Orientalotternb1]|nr:3-hydroxyisobutyrate dehydrogenase [Pasteurellaceae bacterium Orientalotternb1]
MDFSKILSTVLNTAKQSAGNMRKPSESTADTITKVGGGAALAGILSMVLGRSGGASLAKVGSLAALGSIAYQAYQTYQKNQATAADLTPTEFETTSHTAEEKASVILRTMIAAALSDGVLDESERAAIEREAGENVELQQWLAAEVQNPISVAEIARIVGNDVALASQVYLAARAVCQDLSRKEIVFLSQLAEALKLDDALVEQLEKQAGF